MDGAQKDCSAPLQSTIPYAAKREKDYTSPVDAKGSSHYIPRSGVFSLKVGIKNQTSETPSAEPSEGCYGTAWLEHNSTNCSYEYAIYIKTPSYPNTADDAWTYRENDSKN